MLSQRAGKRLRSSPVAWPLRGSQPGKLPILVLADGLASYSRVRPSRLGGPMPDWEEVEWITATVVVLFVVMILVVSRWFGR